MAHLLERKPLGLILAVDGSEHSQAATALLRSLPLPAGSRVTVVAVIAPRQAPGQALLQAALEKADAALRECGFVVDAKMLEGHPAQAITELADDLNPDLIVMGARGLRATLGILLGGVVQQVVEYARWPVLAVRAPFRGLRTLLLATDGSDYSRQAVDFLAGLALPPGCKVTVMNVLPPLVSSEMLGRSWPVGAEVISSLPPLSTEESREWRAEEERLGQAVLAEAAERLAGPGIPSASLLLRGDAATEIIEHARVHETDLLVVGSRGLSQMAGWLLGSVSRKLVHYAGCSVLVVKK